MRRSIQEDIAQELRRINNRLGDIERFLREGYTPKVMPINELSIMPNHLRKSYLAVVNRENCSAMEASILTGRQRAAESLILNQLVVMGWLGKRREGRITKFFVLREVEEALTVLA
jgi:hypothetical protein